MKDLIRKILKEETTISNELIDMVLELGWYRVAEMVGGFDNLYRLAFNNDYHNFLNLFKNLESERSSHNPIILFKNKNGKTVMYYGEKSNTFYFHRIEIWTFFSAGLKLELSQTNNILKKWVFKNYNIEVDGCSMFG